MANKIIAKTKLRITNNIAACQKKQRVFWNEEKGMAKNKK